MVVVVTEDGEGPGGQQAIEAPSLCPTVCLWALLVSPLSAPQEKLHGKFEMNQTHPSLFSQIPFFLSSCPCGCPPSLFLCPSAPSLSSLPVSVTTPAGLCVFLTPCPPPQPRLSPLLNHLNHCVLVTQPWMSGGSNTP